MKGSDRLPAALPHLNEQHNPHLDIVKASCRPKLQRCTFNDLWTQPSV